MEIKEVDNIFINCKEEGSCAQSTISTMPKASFYIKMRG